MLGHFRARHKKSRWTESRLEEIFTPLAWWDAADCKFNLVISSGQHPRQCKMEKLLSEAAREKIWKSTFIILNFTALVKPAKTFQTGRHVLQTAASSWPIKASWTPIPSFIKAALFQTRSSGGTTGHCGCVKKGQTHWRQFSCRLLHDGWERDYLTVHSVIISALHCCRVLTSFINEMTRAVKETKWAKLDLWLRVSSTRSPAP